MWSFIDSLFHSSISVLGHVTLSWILFFSQEDLKSGTASKSPQLSGRDTIIQRSHRIVWSMLEFAAHCRMWQGASKGTCQKPKKRTCETEVPEQVWRAKSEAIWENWFMNMVKSWRWGLRNVWSLLSYLLGMGPRYEPWLVQNYQHGLKKG